MTVTFADANLNQSRDPDLNPDVDPDEAGLLDTEEGERKRAEHNLSI